MNKKIRIVVSLLLVAVLAFAFAGCNASEKRLSKIKEAGKIILGTSADYPPYEFIANVDGKEEIVGFDIEIAKEIAKDLGVTLEIMNMDFDGLLDALKAGNIDFVISGMTPREDRKEQVDFSMNYYTAEQAVVIRTEDADKYKKIEDLKGKTIGAQKGAIQETIASEQIENANIIALKKIPDLVMELKSKKIEALVVEAPVAKGYVNNNKDIIISDIGVVDDTGAAAIAIKKGNEDLVGEINKTLERLIADKTIDKLVAEANEMVEGE